MTSCMTKSYFGSHMSLLQVNHILSLDLAMVFLNFYYIWYTFIGNLHENTAIYWTDFVWPDLISKCLPVLAWESEKECFKPFPPRAWHRREIDLWTCGCAPMSIPGFTFLKNGLLSLCFCLPPPCCGHKVNSQKFREIRLGAKGLNIYSQGIYAIAWKSVSCTHMEMPFYWKDCQFCVFLSACSACNHMN